ncbi:MAG: hypothetical protein KIS76_01010 [Pyrinomonadaceae bacterium]|nr:hypothetical protein [Pyrinomonadaceae bacterium]
MPSFCTNCGKQIAFDAEVCQECASTQYRRPFMTAEREADRFYQAQTTQLPKPPENVQLQQFHQSQMQFSNCRFCGGAGGITTRSTISTGGIIYMAIMFAFAFFSLMIFFPCALVPLALLFLGLLFKEKHFACVNCGQKVN